MKIWTITATLIGFFTLSPATVTAENACQNRIDVTVDGLVCDFCARALEKVFGEKEAVERLTVNLDKGLVQVYLKPGRRLEDETITQLILDSGYNVDTIDKECL